MANNFWRGRAVFITGATGLVGGWLTKHLLEHGAPITALVRDWVPASEFVHQGLADRVNIVRGGLANPHLLERALGEYEIEVVFHLAILAKMGSKLKPEIQNQASNEIRHQYLSAERPHRIELASYLHSWRRLRENHRVV